MYDSLIPRRFYGERGGGEVDEWGTYVWWIGGGRLGLVDHCLSTGVHGSSLGF